MIRKVWGNRLLMKMEYDIRGTRFKTRGLFLSAAAAAALELDAMGEVATLLFGTLVFGFSEGDPERLTPACAPIPTRAIEMEGDEGDGPAVGDFMCPLWCIDVDGEPSGSPRVSARGSFIGTQVHPPLGDKFREFCVA